MNSELAKCPVIVVHEPGRSALHVLLHENITVGRSGADILVDDEQVSRIHAELKPMEGDVVIRDCGSTHGILINGERLSDNTVLQLGDVARMGNVTIELAGHHGNVTITSSEQPLTSLELVADHVSRDKAYLSTRSHSERTLTIVFSDIENSTEIALSLGDNRWFSVLSQHNQLLRSSLTRFSGTEIKSQGDGFMLTFDSARVAIEALVDFQTKLKQCDFGDGVDNIRVRFGAHVGEAIIDRGGDLFGRHVNTAARIAAQASGGEILVSPILREIVEARGDIVFGEPRQVSLKGISDGYIVHPVVWDA